MEEDKRQLRALAKELKDLRNHWEAEKKKDFLCLSVIMLGDGDLGNNKITFVLSSVLCASSFFFVHFIYLF